MSVVDKKNHFTVVDTKDIKPAEWIDGITAIEIVNNIVTLANRLNAKAIGIDAGGGAHIVQPLKMRRLSGQLKCPVYDINFGGKPTEIKVIAKDPSAEYAYNRRAEMHLMLRGMMEAQRVSADRCHLFLRFRSLKTDLLKSDQNLKLRNYLNIHLMNWIVYCYLFMWLNCFT